MRKMIEHPEIRQIETTGYPYRMQEEPEGYDEDAAYEERMERELFGDR